LTALTSSFCIDILGIRKKEMSEKKQKNMRLIVHNTFAIVFLMCVFLFRQIDNGSLIKTLLDIAGYTYGPLLALFVFGIFTKRQVRNELTPLICIAAPALCYILKQNDTKWLGGYAIGVELLIINALITFLLLLAVSKKKVEDLFDKGSVLRGE
jgi:phosphoglycerol transferase MdoB-like AlkP superfamily enzyme